MPDFTQLPVLLLPSRVKQVLLMLLCLAFTAAGVMMSRNGEWMGYLCAGFFGLGVCVFAANMLPGASYLRLEESGFTLRTLFREHTVPWDVIEEFGVYRLKSRKMIGWNYGASYIGKVGLRSANRGLTGFEAALPDTYGMKAEVLAAQLETLRQQYGKESNTVAFILNGEAKAR